MAVNAVASHHDALDITGSKDAVASAPQNASALRPAVCSVLAIISVLAMLGSWLSYRWHQSDSDRRQRSEYLSAAQHIAINLTTIDHAHAESDVQRIVDSATGTFRDEFQQRAKPFVDVVRQSQSTSVGSVTAAGLESMSGDHAEALVAMSVTTSIRNVPESVPRLWRMRIELQKITEGVRVSNVEFVS